MSHHSTLEYIGLLSPQGSLDEPESGAAYAELHSSHHHGTSIAPSGSRRCRFDFKMASFIFVGVMTLVYTLAELGIALWLDSLSLLSDGFHNLSDVLSLVIAFWAVQAKKRSTSDSMSYGWARAEILGGLTNGVFLVSLCLYITLEAIPRYYDPKHLDGSWSFIGIAAMGLVVNTLGTIIFALAGHSHGHSHGGGGHGHSHGGGGHGHSHGGGGHGHSHGGGGHGHSHGGGDHGDEHHLHHHDGDDGNSLWNNCLTRWFYRMDLNIAAVFIHYLGDMISSMIVLAEGLFLHFLPDRGAKWTDYIDPSATLIIVVLILWTTIPIVKRASLILLQGLPSHVKIEVIQKDLEEVPGVLGVHDLHVWSLVEDMLVCSVHVAVEEGCDFSDIIQRLHEILHQYDIHSSTIQPEFHPLHAEVLDVCDTNCVEECDEDWCCKET